MSDNPMQCLSPEDQALLQQLQQILQDNSVLPDGERRQIMVGDPTYNLICGVINRVYGPGEKPEETTFDRQHQTTPSAGVVLLHQDPEGAWYVVLQVRGSHGGESTSGAGKLSFPGGFSHNGDLTYWQIASRESREESEGVLSLKPERMELVQTVRLHGTAKTNAWRSRYDLTSVHYMTRLAAEEVTALLALPPNDDVERWIKVPVSEVVALREQFYGKHEFWALEKALKRLGVELR